MKAFMLMIFVVFGVSATLAIVDDACNDDDKPCVGGDGNTDDRQHCGDSSKKCECKAGYEKTDDKLCRKPLDDTFSCGLDLDCYVIDTLGTGKPTCGKSGTCTCPEPNWDPKKDGEKFYCYTVDKKCYNDDECADRLACKSEKCKCKDGYETAENGLQCRKILNDELQCLRDVDCEAIDTGSEGAAAACSTHGYCECPETTWKAANDGDNNYKCFSLGGKCDNSTGLLCNDRETCEENQCECEGTYKKADNGYQCKKELTDDLSCEIEADCEDIYRNTKSSTSSKSIVECKDKKKCTCTSPKDWSIRKVEGKYETYAPTGSECISNKDCSTIDYTICFQGKCECHVAKSYVTPEKTKCAMKAEEDDGKWLCKTQDNCGFIKDDASFATCDMSKGQCKCADDTWFMYLEEADSDPVCSRSIGSKCSDAKDCNAAITNSTCSSDKVCACEKDFTANNDKTECDYSGSSMIFASSLLLAVSYIVSKAT